MGACQKSQPERRKLKEDEIVDKLNQHHNMLTD